MAKLFVEHIHREYKVIGCITCDHLQTSFYGHHIAGGYNAHCKKKFRKKLCDFMFHYEKHEPCGVARVLEGCLTSKEARDLRDEVILKIPKWCPLDDWIPFAKRR